MKCHKYVISSLKKRKIERINDWLLTKRFFDTKLQQDILT